MSPPVDQLKTVAPRAEPEPLNIMLEARARISDTNSGAQRDRIHSASMIGHTIAT